MFFVNTIIYFILGIISIFIYIIYGFVSLNPGIIFPTLITMSILYAYYKIWFNFDINTLHKDAKKDAKIINEHSDSTTIFKSGELKFGVGATISKARLKLYIYSYFMNLYENAYKNYVEKIEEIKKYKNNKNLDNTNSDKNAEEKELNKKKEEFNEKVNKANIARAERRDAEKILSDFDSKNDKTLKDVNLDSFTSSNFDNSQRKELQKNIRELKTEEHSARNAMTPFVNENVQKKINNAKSILNKGLQAIPGINNINKEGLMNIGVDSFKNAFDNVKIDPGGASNLFKKFIK